MATTSDLLNRMHDIVPAPPVSWWPPAPGWWVVLVVALVIAGVALWFRRAPDWRAEALRELDKIEAEFRTSGDVTHGVAQISLLLRRVALVCRPRKVVASLTGDDWLRFLDEPLDQPEFMLGVGRVLRDAPYAPGQSVDIDALFVLTRRWLKKVE